MVFVRFLPDRICLRQIVPIVPGETGKLEQRGFINFRILAGIGHDTGQARYAVPGIVSDIAQGYAGFYMFVDRIIQPEYNVSLCNAFDKVDGFLCDR